MKKVLLVLIVIAVILAIVACAPIHEHTVTGELIIVKEATCGEEGLANMFCTECGEIVNTISIPKTNNHTVVIVPTEEATCEESGLTEGKYCSACNKVLIQQEIIPASHKFGEWETIEAATKTEDGLAERYCTLCNEYETTVLPFTGSEGLGFALNNDRQSYSVSSIGTCIDTDVVIPRVYAGLPVTIIGYDAFFDCDLLKSVVIPDSVTTISEHAFSSCEWLTSVVIPESVTSIGNDAFNHCHSLTSIELPNSVLSIGDRAFVGCYSLKNINIPASVTSIGDAALSICESLLSIEVDENSEYYKSIDGNLYTKDGKILMQYAIGKMDASFAIPESVTHISYRAFQSALNLTNIVIPNSVVSIGDYAFFWSGIRNIELPASVASLGYSAIGYCNNIIIDEDNEYYKSIDGNLYSKDGKTLILYAIGKTDTSFAIPDSVTSIGNYAFSSCDSLTSIVIPDSVTSIGEYVFSSCYSLTSVVIPDSVTSIGDYAFAWCYSLTSVVIPDSVTSIEDGAFYYCTLLTSIEIPDSVTSIGNQAFWNCNSLTSVVIPDSVTSIGNYAFGWCDSLTSIVIPESVTSIGMYAFDGCDSLEYNEYDNAYYLGNANNPYMTLVKTKNYDISSCKVHCDTKIISKLAFSNHQLLANIDVDENNEYYKSIDGNLYTKDGKTLIQYAIGKIDTSFVIPDSVTSIDEGAFYGAFSLTNIVIPNSVTSIGDYAFLGCSFTSITFEGTVDQWNSITKGEGWNEYVPVTEVKCSDGTLSLN